ncbi:hypothetical protein F5884DRAFT_859493 [Xylogone sp. PMI_703]|nr:hypothetical protein F5884DRAFT_859493 [Xylogone sp. PMI_703]
MATQLVFVTVNPNIDITEESSIHGATWVNILTILTGQPGFQRWYWGFKVKQSEVLQLLVDWRTIEAYNKFKESGAFQKFRESLCTLTDAEPRICVATLSPHPAPGFDAPATEVVFINNPHEDFYQSLAEFSKFLVSNTGQIGQYSVGKVYEEGNTTHQLYLVVGWESVEAQKNMMASQEFPNKVGLVRDHCESLALDYVKLTRSSLAP